MRVESIHALHRHCSFALLVPRRNTCQVRSLSKSSAKQLPREASCPPACCCNECAKVCVFEHHGVQGLCTADVFNSITAHQVRARASTATPAHQSPQTCHPLWLCISSARMLSPSVSFVATTTHKCDIQ
eukprot:199403-Amphidinium_carterae.3